MPRMRILNAAGRHALNIPGFDSAERKRHFDFSQTVMHVARGLRGPANRIGFLLACGYFRASRRFFSPERFHERDIGFVSRALDLPLDTFTPENYIDMTRLRHQRRILDLHGFRPFGDPAEAQLTTEIATMARAHLKPRLIFGRCVDFLIERRIEVPGAWRLSELIRTGLSAHKSDLIRLVDTHLTPKARQLLDSLFVQETGKPYRLTLLKRSFRFRPPERAGNSS